MSDESVDQFVGDLAPSDEAKPKKRKRKAAEPVEASPPALPPPTVEPDDIDGESGEPALDDDDEALLPRELPRPKESVRTLGTLQTKYQIGTSQEFMLQLHRVLPKWFPGGIQAQGYITEYRQPVTEEYIAEEYGGGTYKAMVMGPDPKSGPNSMRPYESVLFEISGPPNTERIPRSTRAKLDAAGAQATPAGSYVGPPAAPTENPKLAEKAMEMATSMAEREREERHRLEDKQATGFEVAKQMFAPVVEAEKRRADDVLAAERQRSEQERKFLEQQMHESRDQVRRLEERLEQMDNGRPSLMTELKELVPMFKGDAEAASAAAGAAQRTAESITKSILDRHQSEMESLQKQHQTMLESIRNAHVQEMATMREAQAASLLAEREAGRTREQRHEETLRVEREERRRDAELYKRTADERDQQWRDRMEQQELNLKTMWESRVETQKSNYESQLQWMRSETEQLQTRLRELQAQVSNQGDIVAQLGRMRELREVSRDAFGLSDASSSPSGGIGLSGDEGGGGDAGWASTIDTALKNLPEILRQYNMLGGPGGGMPQPGAQQQAPQQQQPPPPGTVVNTPQGLMVVVNTPQGPALAPKEQYDAMMAQQQGQQGQHRGTSRQLQQGRQRGMFATPKPSSGLPVPNMAEGLPKPGDPLEPKQFNFPDQQTGQPVPVAAAPQAPVPQQPQQQRRAPQQGAPQGQRMDKTQQLIANEVAKLVDKSVNEGDEPEEFVQRVLQGGYPPQIVRTIASMSDEQVIAGIMAVQPNSAGATSMGQRFVREALAALRAAV